MVFLNEYLHYLIDVVLVNGFGWAFFLAVLVWMMYYLRRIKNNTDFVNSVEWVFLEVKIDELNEKSPLAMEQVFAALHAIHQNFTFGEILAGKAILWVSCELVSLGGRVSYIFKIPTRYRNLFESAMFAQYPKAEITEVEDYMRNIPLHYNPDKADFDFWGTQLNKKKSNAYPIRTYAQENSFEHSSQETYIDPISNIIEVMSDLQPHELMVFQLVIRPINDDWKKNTKSLLDKLKGVPKKHEEKFLEKAFFTIPRLVGDILVSFISAPTEAPKSPARVQEEPPSLMLHRTDVEKMIISSIERSLGKIGFEVRIRLLYLTPKGKLNRALRVPEIIGAFRNFDDVNLNGLKPDIGHTWTDKAFKISQTLERPYLESNILKRKRHLLRYFISRSYWKGSGHIILNVEELATIFHFPQVPHTRVSQLERVHTVKSAPPMDLPIK